MAEIASAGGEASARACDVSSEADVKACVADCVSRYGSLYALVNMAGLLRFDDTAQLQTADWQQIIDINLTGTMLLCREVLPHLVETRGSIVNAASTAALAGLPCGVAYSASKGGVNLVTKVLALEWSSRGVTVNAVAPTFIYTPGTAERLDQPEYLADVLRRLPIGRVGTTTDVAAAVIYLASPAGGMVSGHTLLVDGAWTAQ